MFAVRVSRNLRRALSNRRLPSFDSVFTDVAVGIISRNSHSGEGGRSLARVKENIKAAYKARTDAFIERLNKVNRKYEQFVGLSDVQEAQKKVKEAEAAFLEARAKERAIMREMVATRDKLKNVRERLSHVDYSNRMYLQLASEQHDLVTQEELQATHLEEAEEHERDSLLNLSNAMRESYEHERARVERTKYWSVIGSVIGTVIGMIGTIYVNRVRTKDLLKAVKEAGDKSDLCAKVDSLTSISENKQQAVALAISTLSEHMSEMSNALEVRNMEALSGFINNPFNDNSSSSTNSSSQKEYHGPQNFASIDVLTQEMEQYNTALLSLSNAVAALSNLDSDSGKVQIQSCLESLMQGMQTINSKLDNSLSSGNHVDLSGISKTLKSIDERLTDFQYDADHKSGEIISELYTNSVKEPRSNWRGAVKDLALWGSVLCCVYLFIKV